MTSGGTPGRVGVSYMVTPLPTVSASPQRYANNMGLSSLW